MNCHMGQRLPDDCNYKYHRLTAWKKKMEEKEKADTAATSQLTWHEGGKNPYMWSFLHFSMGREREREKYLEKW